MPSKVETISVHIDRANLSPGNSLCCGKPMEVVDGEFELVDPDSNIVIKSTEPIPVLLCPCGLDYGDGTVYDLLDRAALAKLNELGIHSKVRSALEQRVAVSERLSSKQL